MTKIEALQKTIFNLKNNVYEYNWASSNSCNCGVLARTILGGTCIYDAGFGDVKRLDDGALPPWSAKSVCLTTGAKLTVVFQALKDTGFTNYDIIELEHLSNPEINKSLGWEFFDGSNFKSADKTSVILYLKEWVKMLREPQTTLTAYTPEIKEQPAKFVTYSKIIENIPVNAN